MDKLSNKSPTTPMDIPHAIDMAHRQSSFNVFIPFLFIKESQFKLN